jgi:hypothetical protein
MRAAGRLEGAGGAAASARRCISPELIGGAALDATAQPRIKAAWRMSQYKIRSPLAGRKRWMRSVSEANV